MAPIFASEESNETAEKPTADASTTAGSEVETSQQETEDEDAKNDQSTLSEKESENVASEEIETEEVEDTTPELLETEIADAKEASETSTPAETVTVPEEKDSSTEIVQGVQETDTSDSESSTTSTSTQPKIEDSTEIATTTNSDVESDTATGTPETTESETATSTEDEVEDSPVEDENTTEPPTITEEEDAEESVEPSEVAETPEPQVALNIAVNEENQFTFSKDECVLVSDGTFYCTETTETPEVTNEDRVFAAPDGDGDKEIYIEKDGTLTQITKNTYDDDAPQFDELSNTLVWHRLIDGRYQIIVYDIETEEEEQLTHDRYNNMQPQRFDNSIVWQGWVGSDWEIFLLQGEELTMLTDNQVEDITPSINGNHVVWQSFEENTWKMKVYDIRTKTTQTIEDAEGGSIQNPRFVLVYDTKFKTGDVETRGFDLESGEVVPLGTQPAPIPQEIPEPEETPEKRALISPTIQLKKESETDEGGDNEADDSATTTETGTGDIVIPPFVDSDVATGTDMATADELDTEDLIIPEIEDTSTSSVEHIPDVVIETTFVPQTGSSTDETDSQEPVAVTE